MFMDLDLFHIPFEFVAAFEAGFRISRSSHALEDLLSKLDWMRSF